MAALVASFALLFAARPLEAASKTPAAAPTVPVKSVHHGKSKMHHAAHVSKHKAPPASKTMPK
jgi:hypothetical protein